MKRFVVCLLAVLVLAMPASAKVWEWDCSADPTAGGDWSVVSGDPFNGNIQDGIYLGGQQIRTASAPLWNTPTVKVNLSWKAETDGVFDASLWMPIDAAYDAETDQYTQISPMMVYLTYDAETDTQRLAVQDVYEWWAGQEIAVFEGLPNEIIDTELVWDTVADTVSVSINGELQGTYDYTVFMAPGGLGTSQFAAIGGGGAMQIDSIRIEAVPEPATMLLLGGGLLGLIAARRRRK